ARPHALGGSRARRHTSAARREGGGKLVVARAHHGDDGIDAGRQVTKRGDPDGCAIGKSSEEFVAAEASRAACREQDSDDRTRTHSGDYSESSRNLPSFTVTSTRARSSMPL